MVLTATKLTRPALHLLAALPLLWLAVSWVNLLFIDQTSLALSAEPVAFSQNFTGLWAFRLLLLSLAATPARVWLGWRQPLLYRRMLGLWAFAYALVHFLLYWLLDLQLAFGALAADIAKRPFILLGMVGFLALLPLAATSTRAAIKRLGGRPWQALHRAVYLAGIAVAVHFILRVKGFQWEPWIYAAILVLLLLSRVKFLQPRRRAL
ncbi:protein-methionine-sulfoxide reductase heme-binding subunit MsrQ [Sandaracinobacteroides saxicola]|uniref:Protein-methionine-sulfoxide reductase heme-binding subunit MsrQ n=1 Tax=Sandaracinobacteroides saxicola TaxID=2759707 RepID=A0A7G5IIF0_9SPHN|nr:protein-methionine-sulfoxide reductase heme-binding subunit MsrQ [Sandaracinobacteroides saxicola]QMW23142.1 sulfoxide reductase heme-binding subunit YedZ [Sandaracinobacteroides saxicola]